ncbi:MAG: carboxypeptidase regulatory-like domain-containing protein [Flavobacterium sp.]|nr:MAG: carboxypeptidase regulatory-like domain-containing protein [Flavobacterium sp.]
MKLYIIFLLLASNSFSQNGILSGTVMERDASGAGFPGVLIELLQNGQTFAEAETDFYGNYLIDEIPKGNYELRISYMLIKSIIIQDFAINETTLIADFIFPEPCKKSKRFCPNNHSDNIIPIEYGFPSKKMMRKAKNGKIKLGGCDSSLCDKWHCTIHDLDF